MDEYYCPNCGATLNIQSGFDPDNSYWTCTECGKQLYGDDAYSGDRFSDTVWYCDSCGARLSIQPGFSDYNDTWCCTECGYINPINDDVIFVSEDEYQASRFSDDSSSTVDDSSSADDDEFGYGEEWQYDNPRRCECCGRLLNKQEDYEDYLDWFECTGCGFVNDFKTDDHQSSQASASHSVDSSGYREPRFSDIVWYCDSCGACLSEQPGFSDYNDFWICTECGYETRLEDDGYRPHIEVVDIETECDEGDEEDKEDEDDFVIKDRKTRQKPKSGKKAAKSNKNHENKHEKRGCLAAIIDFYAFVFRALIWILVVSLGALLIGSGIYYGYNYLHGATNTIQVGKSSVELAGMKNYEVVSYFQKLGFTNVTEKGIEDVTGNELEQEGTVTAVSIDGQTSFGADAKIPFNKHIEVIYRKIKLVKPPLSYKVVKEKDFELVKEEFESVGFVNVITDPIYDIKLGWFNKEGEIKEVSVNGNTQYSIDEEYRPDVSVVIFYHAAKADESEK